MSIYNYHIAHSFVFSKIINTEVKLLVMIGIFTIYLTAMLGKELSEYEVRKFSVYKPSVKSEREILSLIKRCTTVIPISQSKNILKSKQKDLEGKRS